MMQTAAFAIIGVTLLSLVASHPTPDYRLTKKLISDVYLQYPRSPPNEDHDNLKPEAKQGFSTMFAPFAAAILTPLTPLLTNFASGLSTFTSGLSSLINANKTTDSMETQVVNSPESSVPYVFVAQVEDNAGAPSALPPAATLLSPFVAPLAPPFDVPMTVPLPYPPLEYENVPPSQHFFASHQILIPLLPSSHYPKEDVKCLTDQSVDELTIKSGVPESS